MPFRTLSLWLLDCQVTVKILGPDGLVLDTDSSTVVRASLLPGADVRLPNHTPPPEGMPNHTRGGLVGSLQGDCECMVRFPSSFGFGWRLTLRASLGRSRKASLSFESSLSLVLARFSPLFHAPKSSCLDVGACVSFTSPKPVWNDRPTKSPLTPQGWPRRRARLSKSPLESL